MAVKGDIFAKSNIAWPQCRFFLLNSRCGIFPQLEGHNILTITKDTITKAAQAMGNIMSAGFRVDWLDQILQRIHEDREYRVLFQKVSKFKHNLWQSKNLLKHVEEILTKKKPSTVSMRNYKIKIYEALHLDVFFVAYTLSLCNFLLQLVMEGPQAQVVLYSFLKLMKRILLNFVHFNA